MRINLEDFGVLLLVRRRRLGLSPRELGERAGVSDATIRRLEQGRLKRPLDETLIAVAVAAGIDLALVGADPDGAATHPLLLLVDSLPPDLYWIAEGVLRLLVSGSHFRPDA